MVAGVDEFSVGGFGADSAVGGVACAVFVEAVHAEEAVAVEYEFASLFETGLAFVAVLRVAVHNIY